MSGNDACAAAGAAPRASFVAGNALAPSFPRWRRAVLVARVWGVGEALWLFVTLRLTLSLVAYASSFLTRVSPPCTWDGGPPLHTSGLDFRLVGVWLRWDACWYEKIATVGYRRDDPSVNFFPLFPILQRGAGVLLGGNLTVAGLAVAGVAYIAAIAGLYRLIADDFDEATAERAVLYLSIFPGAFFLFAPFTESLFLALSAWCLLAARRGVWIGAGLLALLAGATRIQGILLILPLAWECFRQWRAGQPQPRAVFALVVAPLGLVCFIIYSQLATGWTAFETQRTIWGNIFHPPWTVLALSWRRIGARGDAIEALNLALVVLFCVVLVAGARRLPLSYTLLAVPQLLLILLHENFVSPLTGAIRYTLVIYPVFVLVALWGRNRRVHHSWLLLSFSLLGVLLFAFLTGAFVA